MGGFRDPTPAKRDERGDDTDLGENARGLPF